jgi:DNA polymerase II small subunit/DNA polymerase delta subunit B
MDRKEAVRELISRGEIPTPELIKKMISGEIETTKLAEDKGKEKIIIRKTKPEKKSKLSVDDFISYYKNKYTGLRKTLSSKIEATSINQVKGVFGEVGIIGMVREKTPTGYIIEDETGTIEAVLNHDSVRPNDVIGITGQVKENKMFAKAVVFPDIPLTQKYGSLPGVNMVVSRNEKKDANPPNIYLDAGGLSNGSKVMISDSKSTLKILFYSPKTGIGVKECSESLKKRHLVISSKDVISPNDEFMIDEIPDILWANSDTKFIENYKGVVIISPGKEEVSIDLGTKRAQ